MWTAKVDLSNTYYHIGNILDKYWIIYIFIPGIHQRCRKYSDLSSMSSKHFLWAGLAAQEFERRSGFSAKRVLNEMKVSYGNCEGCQSSVQPGMLTATANLSDAYYYLGNILDKYLIIYLAYSRNISEM